jgi:glycosyltransferase involved in cell wall biosynthesis
MEGLTESMLLGEAGAQHEDLAELVNYLRHHEKPDIVHFSNALLLGMAGMIRREVGVPVVCSLQDEDVWIDAMEPSAQQKMWDLMAVKASKTDALIAVSDWFGAEMKKKMKLGDNLIHTVPIGIETALYRNGTPALKNRTIGYLSRLCEENGLEVLVDAFILLRKDPRFSDVKLRITGGHTGDDRRFIRKQKEKLMRVHLEHKAMILEDFGLPALYDFFEGLTVLSVPVLKGEAFGIYQLEAMASGIPVVQPALGAFPEIIGKTGGGIVYQPNDAPALAAALASLLADPEKLKALGAAGRKGVEAHFEGAEVTEKLIRVYQSLNKKT